MLKIKKVLYTFILLTSCSTLEQTEEKKIHKQNAKGEYILRNHDEYQFQVEAPKLRQREKYPWEEEANK